MAVNMSKQSKTIGRSIVAFLLALLIVVSGAFTTPVSVSAVSAGTINASASAAKGTVKVTGSSVNVRKGAGTKYGIITTVKKGKTYSYTATKKVSGVTWYKIVVSSSKTGWISGKYAKVVAAVTTKPTTTTTTSATTKATTTITTVSTAASSATTIQSTDTTQATTTTAASQSVARGTSVRIKAKTNVYKDATSTSKVIATAAANDEYSVRSISADGLWYEILYSASGTGWIKAQYCALLTNENTMLGNLAPSMSIVYPGTRKFVNGSTVNMRKGAGTKYSVIKKLSRNAVVYVQSTTKNGWSKIIYNGTTGYMMSKYLSTNAVKNYGYKTEGSVSSSRKTYANKYMSKIPTKLWNRFVSEGWTLRITTKDIKKTYAPNHSVSGSFSGLTMYEKRLCVVGYSEKRIRQALLHEFGHFVDGQLNYTSYSQAFNEIYKAEKGKAKFKDQVDKHCYSTAQEYFAEAFLQYLVYPSNLKKNAPKTYAYIKNCIAKF